MMSTSMQVCVYLRMCLHVRISVKGTDTCCYVTCSRMHKCVWSDRETLIQSWLCLEQLTAPAINV